MRIHYTISYKGSVDVQDFIWENKKEEYHDTLYYFAIDSVRDAVGYDYGSSIEVTGIDYNPEHVVNKGSKGV